MAQFAAESRRSGSEAICGRLRKLSYRSPTGNSWPNRRHVTSMILFLAELLNRSTSMPPGKHWMQPGGPKPNPSLRARKSPLSAGQNISRRCRGIPHCRGMAEGGNTTSANIGRRESSAVYAARIRSDSRAVNRCCETPRQRPSAERSARRLLCPEAEVGRGTGGQLASFSLFRGLRSGLS